MSHADNSPDADKELNRERLDVKMVADAIRSARLLDPVLRRRWLTLLPHMQAEELRELWSILKESEEQLDQLDAQVNEPGAAQAIASD